MAAASEPLGTLEFITNELTKAGVNYYVRRDDISVPCPFKCELDRTDYKQKLQLHFTGEMFHCWVCKSRGNYNKLAEAWGMQKIPLNVRNSISSLERDLNLIIKRSSTGVPKLPGGLAPFTEEWRGVPAQFLKTFNSKLFFDVSKESDRIYRILWPVTFNGKPQGWVAGYIESDDGKKPNPPYLNTLKSKRVLFGIDTKLVRSSRTVVLVEGPYDCIRLQYEGVPAVAILGTGNWTKHKAVMLKQRDSGPTSKVILAFDGDKAGDECRVAAFQDLSPIFDKESLVCFDVPDKKDPGNMSDMFVDELREMCS